VIKKNHITYLENEQKNPKNGYKRESEREVGGGGGWGMENEQKKLESTLHEEGFEKDPEFDLN
jgi:hypothetical protein